MARSVSGRRERRLASAATVRQMPFGRVENRYPRFEVMSADQVEAIHHASLSLLKDTGMEVMHDESRALLRRGGADVDETSQRVRFDPAMIESLIGTVPSSFTLQARNPERNLKVGDQSLIFAATGGPAFVSDLKRGRRAGNYADMCDYIKLVHQLNVIHQEGGCPCEPTDLDPESRHLDFYQAAITLTDKNWQCWALGTYRVEDALEMASIALGQSREELARNPALLTVVNSNSPLRLDVPMGEGLLAMARAGQPVAITPFTLSGAMSPVTIAGALTQQNAEALALIALSQLAAPGAPVLYGGFTSNVDMRSGAPAFGTPEYAKAQIASGQLARRYRIPFRSSNVTASNAVDGQAAYESGMSLWSTVIGGVDLIEHAAGWLEGGLTASFEKLVLDAEMLQMMRAFLDPVPVDDQTLALSTIADVGPGGHFFGTDHTLARFETAFYAPMLSDWRNFETWSEDGARTATERAAMIAEDLLRSYVAPPLDPAKAEALEAYVVTRKAEIARGQYLR